MTCRCAFLVVPLVSFHYSTARVTGVRDIISTHTSQITVTHTKLWLLMEVSVVIMKLGVFTKGNAADTVDRMVKTSNYICIQTLTGTIAIG